MNKEMKKDPGKKFDFGKHRYDLIPGDSLDELVKVYNYGAKKYEDENWRKGMSWKRIFGALMRHSWAWFRGEDIDPESGLHHMAHAAWQCFTLLNYSRTRPEFDDRVKDMVCQVIEKNFDAEQVKSKRKKRRKKNA